MRPSQVLPLLVRVELGVMVMKGYSTLPKVPELEAHSEAVWCHILNTRLFFGWILVGGSYLSLEGWGRVAVF